VINNKPILELKNVSKNYDCESMPAVNNVSMSLKKGKIYALMGKSGCGKSTLLNMIATLDSPTNGTIFYEGKSIEMIGSLSDFRRNFLGLIFQFHHLIPILTLSENIEIAMLSNNIYSNSDRKKKAKSLLVDMGLENKIDSYANIVSGGEKQRGAIARALVNNPALILADEPTGSVDSKTSQMILEKLKNYVEINQATLLIATHDPLVANIADRVFYMRDGVVLTNED
jgi:putative ABC transport system ATP-binding protein